GVLVLADWHWRDVLARTWTIQTLGGRDTLVSALKRCAAHVGPKGFRIAENRTAPRRVTALDHRRWTWTRRVLETMIGQARCLRSREGLTSHRADYRPRRHPQGPRPRVGTVSHGPAF